MKKSTLFLVSCIFLCLAAVVFLAVSIRFMCLESFKSAFIALIPFAGAVWQAGTMRESYCVSKWDEEEAN